MKDFNPFCFFFGTIDVKGIHSLYLHYAAPIVKTTHPLLAKLIAKSSSYFPSM